MSPTTVRRVSETERVRGFGNPGKRWLALFLVIVSVGAAVWVLGRDIAWETRRREARRQGLIAENNGNYAAARAYYETALANHPYDWETHLALAGILNHNLNDNENALRHYLYALAYSPEPAIVDRTSQRIEVLKLMRAGELENPFDALEDMFMAMEAGAESAFRRRLSAPLRANTDAYWESWRRRGRGTVTSCRVTSDNNGFYDAVLELDFSDSTSMSMHFYCPIRDIWRLELSFP